MTNRRSKTSELAADARAWVASAEGKRKISESFRRDNKATENLSKAMRVNPQILKEPFTV